MSAKKAIEREIGRYLEDVAARLDEMPADEKDDVLRDIESHIYAALEKSGPEPTIDGLNVILAGMDRPSAWADSARGEGDATRPGAGPEISSATTPAAPKRTYAPRSAGASLSKTALAAGAMTPLALALVAFAYIQMFPRIAYWPGTGINNSGLGLQALEYRTTAFFPGLTPYPALRYAVLGIALAGFSTVLGLVALSQIRAARGALSGVPLAAACAVLFPVLAADAFIVALAKTATSLILGYFRHEKELSVATVIIAASVTLITVLSLSIWAFRKACRWAGRAAAEDSRRHRRIHRLLVTPHALGRLPGEDGFDAFFGSYECLATAMGLQYPGKQSKGRGGPVNIAPGAREMARKPGRKSAADVFSVRASPG